MPGKKQVQTRIASDTEAKLEEFKEDRDLSQADALRRLVRSGLTTEGYPVAEANVRDQNSDWIDDLLTEAVSIAGVVAVMASITGIGALAINEQAIALSAVIVAVSSLITAGLILSTRKLRLVLIEGEREAPDRVGEVA